MEKEIQIIKTNGLHPEAETLRNEMRERLGNTAVVIFDLRNTRLDGDVASQLIHEGTKQGWPGYGHPLDMVQQDIMATPDIPTLNQRKKRILGDAALAINTHLDPISRNGGRN